MQQFILQNIKIPICREAPKAALYTGEANDVLSLATYFNSFDTKKWFKSTTINNLHIHLKIKGSADIDIFEYNSSMERELFHRRISENLDEEITSQNDKLLGIQIRNRSNDFKFISGYYYTLVDPEEINQINLGIAICTFKREEYLLRNLQLFQDNFLQNSDSPLHDHLDVFVADNGQSVADYLKSKEIQLDKHIQIFSNINAGGSAGFTRCIIEFLKAKNKPSHILLMDDDATFDPESIFRTYALLSLIKQEHQQDFIGGTMFKEEFPSIQNENGAQWNASDTLHPKFFGRDLDLAKKDSIIINVQDYPANYNAWFFCCMPLATIEQNGLPLPFFIHFDDIEYGVRCAREIILLNGICVWHPTSNKYSPNMRFYDTRNGFITSLLHSREKSQKKAILFQTLKSFVDSMISYKYIDWEMFYAACRDVFKEKDWCLKKDPIKLHSQVYHSKYKIYPLSEITCEKENVSDQELIYRRKYADSLGFKHIVDAIIGSISLFLPAYKNDLCTINSTPPFYAPSYRGRKRIFIHILGTENCFLLEKSLKKTLFSLIQLIKLLHTIFWNYSKTKKRFNEARQELTSLDFWTKYLQLDK